MTVLRTVTVIMFDAVCFLGVGVFSIILMVIPKSIAFKVSSSYIHESSTAILNSLRITFFKNLSL